MFLDYIYLGIVIISLCFGYISGFVKTLLSCIILIFCVYGSQFVLPYTAEASLMTFSDPFMASCFTYMWAFMICYLLGTVIIARITKITQDSKNGDSQDSKITDDQEPKVGRLSSFLGVIFGGIRGVFLPLLVVSVLYILNVPLANYGVTAESVVTQYVYVKIRDKNSLILNSIVGALSPGNNQMKGIMKNINNVVKNNNLQKGGNRKSSNLDLSSFTH